MVNGPVLESRVAGGCYWGNPEGLPTPGGSQGIFRVPRPFC